MLRTRKKSQKYPKLLGKIILSSILLIGMSLFIVQYTRTVMSEEYQESDKKWAQTAADANTQVIHANKGQNHIVVSISQQTLFLYIDNNLVKSYPISTSKYGIGGAAGSNKTPLGQHVIEKKIGDGAPEGTIFKSRVNTGHIAEIDAPNTGDLVTTRILWLKGREPGKNAGGQVDSYNRFIYIHGTAEERLIGQPASHGCIRMKNTEVIDLFNRVSEGTPVEIVE